MKLHNHSLLLADLDPFHFPVTFAWVKPDIETVNFHEILVEQRGSRLSEISY
jgi:hypothetical protein